MWIADAHWDARVEERSCGSHRGPTESERPTRSEQTCAARGQQSLEQHFTISRHASLCGGSLFHTMLRLFGFAFVFERLHDVASSIVNSNQDGMRPAVRLCVAYRIGDRV
jgi:hypothetical protein